MSDEHYAKPVLVRSNDESILLDRVSLTGSDADYNEAFIQDLAFKHPNCLPINEIDRAYEGLIPVCKELSTPAGPLDILYVTPKGRLVIVEAKLWRNPEARRKVIGQILDYAKELARWDYEDLQREVSRATKRKGNVLYEIVAEQYPETDESEFVDEVTRSISNGRFLLLILGDGIREGVGAIAEFLDEVGSLEFTLGLVEIAIYKAPNNELLLQPRVLAKTAIFKRTVVSIKDNQVFLEEDTEGQEEDTELTELQKFYLEFWPELLNELKLDDPSQPYPKSTGKIGNIFFPMPPSGGQCWITTYFFRQRNEVGVYLTFIKGDYADHVYEMLLVDKDTIEEELGIPVAWQSRDGKHSIWSHRIFDDTKAEKNREEIKEFLNDTINRFVNTFRPRLARIAEDIDKK